MWVRVCFALPILKSGLLPKCEATNLAVYVFHGYIVGSGLCTNIRPVLGRFLHHRGATRPCCFTPDICHHSCIGCWRVSRRWMGCSLNDRTANFHRFFTVYTPKLHIRPTILVSWNIGSGQCNGIQVMFLFVAWYLSCSCFSCFLLLCRPSWWKHCATSFWIKNNCISRTTNWVHKNSTHLYHDATFTDLLQQNICSTGSKG